MTRATEQEKGNASRDLRLQRGRDLKRRLLEWYILFVGSVIAGALIFNFFAQKRLEEDVLASDVSLAEAIAIETDANLSDETRSLEDLANWLAIIAADRSAMVTLLDERGRVALRQNAEFDQLTELAWVSWQADVMREARNEPAGAFISTDPAGGEWLHAFVTTPGHGWHVIVQRPSGTALATAKGFNRGLAIAIGVYIVGGIFFWLVLSRQIITPLAQLENFSGLIRWRGQAQPVEQAQIDRLAAREDQVGSLARSLTAMAQDVERRFMQLAMLLETSRIVAATLDVSEVIDKILDRVQPLFNVDRCAIVALDRRAGVFRIRASRGLSEAYVRRLRIEPSEPNSPAMRSLRNGTPIQVSDTEMDLSYVDARPRERAQAAGHRSLLAVPLLTQHAPPAVLLLYKAEPYHYSYAELELATSFANHAAIAMENAALYLRSDEQLQEQTRRLEAIVESLEDGLILESLAGQVLFCNRQLARLVGLPRRQVQQAQSAELVRHVLAQALEPDLAQAAWQTTVSGPEPRVLDLTLGRADGPVQDLRIQVFDVTDAQGERIGRGQLWQDITADKELDRMKSALISTVSHELRTPLAAIKGYASTLLADDVAWPAAAQQEFLQTISDESDRLAQLVKNLLDMSRIEAGMLDMHLDEHTVTDIVTAAARQVQPPLQDRLQLDLPPDLPAICVDADRIETVIRNLLQNAVKYSPSDMPIELTARRENGAVVVRVRDHGNGVPSSLHEKIFDRFYRVDNRLTRHHGGAGLGLAICKGFVKAHGGQIHVRDGHPGAVFVFSLPL